ncbi:hypothetical protein SAMN05421666_3142 [Roseovarius nanhaiticus]|uniref:Uncharacterized protein n=1 Tax=Roseovarius nanhaiticus TaxID=573024 RepID=A0A1N7HIN2_9RHOB|nr:hypothetical protein [Roseovarius nanhaiticus]SEK92178.1 hypothetical protein SAMN05216208_2174 [Roseovarius nanhaiticus]SIS24643.1 hypothetical protein SAMN05421666_3142 [Roseovarius nanhaiticus]
MSNLIVRRDSFVRQLSPSTQINAENAFIDRIRIDVGDWALFGERDHICEALSGLREAEVTSVDGECLPLFNNQLVERIRDVRHLKFRSNPNRDSLGASKPLISGKAAEVLWQSRLTSPQDGEVGRLAFEATLNHTRFVQAQALKRITRLDRPKLVSEYVLAISPDENWYENEIPLRPATNLIIGPNKKYAFALASPRGSQLREYLTLAQSVLSESVQTAFQHSKARAVLLPYFSIREIEFYWEFDSNAPIDWVLQLREILSEQAITMAEDWYDTAAPSLEIQRQSPCIKLKLTQNISIKIYAKTTRRVRFEVTLKDSAIHNAVVGGRRRDSIEGVVSMIAPLAEVAVRRLKPILQSIVADPPPPGSFTAVELMYQITRTADNAHTAEAIIAALVAFGKVVPYGNPRLLSVVHALRDLGVLRTLRPRSRIYVVTDEYRDALASLRRYR